MNSFMQELDKPHDFVTVSLKFWAPEEKGREEVAGGPRPAPDACRTPWSLDLDSPRPQAPPGPSWQRRGGLHAQGLEALVPLAGEDLE